MQQYSRHSHAIVSCECEFKVSPKCSGARTGAHRDFEDNRSRNNGKYICLACSRFLKNSGRKNPNARYSINDSMFKKIDSDAKAYLLGWIASDGSLSHRGSITINIHKKDIDILRAIKASLKLDVPIFKTKTDMVGICLNSKEMVSDVASLIGIDLSKKSLKKDSIVKMPMLDTEDLQWAFIRGYFDGDGSINQPSDTHRSPSVCIASYSPFIRNGIAEFCKIPCKIYSGAVYWSGNNALEFLSKIYPNNCLSLNRKNDLYRTWYSWTPSVRRGKKFFGNIEGICWSKIREDAVIPSKMHVTDSGYDITVVHKIKTIGDVTFYGAGLKLKPPFGYYLDLVPRSSIAKTGYILANSVGIIDRTYVGEIIVALRKVNDSAPELELPCRIAQVIPRQIVHFDMVEVTDLEDTTRGSGGFGSTGK